MTDGNDSVDAIIFDGMPTGGLTKREYFAAMAMQGLLAHYGAYGTDNMKGLLPADMILATDYADSLIVNLNALPTAEVSK